MGTMGTMGAGQSAGPLLNPSGARLASPCRACSSCRAAPLACCSTRLPRRSWCCTSACACSNSWQCATEPRCAATIKGVSCVMGRASTVALAASKSSMHWLLSGSLAGHFVPLAANQRGVAPLLSLSSTSAPSCNHCCNISGNASSAARCMEWRPPALRSSAAQTLCCFTSDASRAVPPCARRPSQVLKGRAFGEAQGLARGRPAASSSSSSKHLELPAAAAS
mmetsp:Transcript_41201/g.68195  ORF Transcript_41201/g.68195 Transcript_41201/m.68195 type:complete len:223 (+) Transcript_41201:223-891(+)